MTQLDPIIAVKNVESSTRWYEDLFGFKRKKGGHDYFSVLLSENDETILCLHKWGEHEHPTMRNNEITPGNGLILYFKTGNLDLVRKKADDLRCHIEEEVHVNPNSSKKEFSVRDPDNYFITVTEYHTY